MADCTVSLADILVLRQAEFGWHCERDGLPLFIAKGQVALGATVPAVGTRGSIQVREFAVHDLYPEGINRHA